MVLPEMLMEMYRERFRPVHDLSTLSLHPIIDFYGVAMRENMQKQGLERNFSNNEIPAQLDAMTAYVLHGDAECNAKLCELIRSASIDARGFLSTNAFLEHTRTDGPCCLILDVRLPGDSGLVLQRRLKDMGDPIPMIFATRFADVETCVRAMKAGAADFLVKPVRDQQFLDSIVSALEKDRERILRLHMVTEVKIRYRSLSQREREVMSLAVAGMLNKNIADHLGLSEITVKIHRGNAMRKMQAKTLANLVTMAHSLGIVNFNAHCRNTDEVAVSIGE